MSGPAGPARDTGLTVLVADESRSALDDLARVLKQLGHEVTPYAVSVPEAVELIAREDPDCAFVMVHQDDEHALALISEAVEYSSGPVIAQLREADVDFVARAAERGVAAYVESTSPEAVQGAIEVARRRYRETAALGRKVEQLETALERKSVIERAKGVLMERHRISDVEAFDRLRVHARTGRRRVYDVARAVLEGHALLPKS